VAATARLWLTGWTKLALAAWRMKAERRRKSLTTAVNSSRQFDVVVSARRRPVASGSPQRLLSSTPFQGSSEECRIRQTICRSSRTTRRSQYDPDPLD
jgi:hypothetical protein